MIIEVKIKKCGLIPLAIKAIQHLAEVFPNKCNVRTFYFYWESLIADFHRKNLKDLFLPVVYHQESYIV